MINAMTTLLHVSLFLKHQDRVLLVQEADPEDEGRWNLPGGHVEPGEPITEGAVREAFEETGLRVRLTHLLSVYAGPGTLQKRAIRFVFRADFEEAEAIAGDGVLAVRIDGQSYRYFRVGCGPLDRSLSASWRLEPFMAAEAERGSIVRSPPARWSQLRGLRYAAPCAAGR